MRKPLWLAPALLLAGCRSEQVVVQSRAAAPVPVVATAPFVVADTSLTATVTVARPVVPPTVAAPITAQSPYLEPAAPRRAAAPKLPVAVSFFSAKPLVKKLAHRLQRRTTEGVAESGLGGIGLFAIGVVLAILAGLAALVNVIFSVGFFTALGYAAAGLVVLFLLYSLFSGGKKK